MNTRKLLLLYPSFGMLNKMENNIAFTTLLEQAYRMNHFFKEQNIIPWLKDNMISNEPFLLITDWDTDLNVVAFLNAYPTCQCIMIDTMNKPAANQIDKRIKSIPDYDTCYVHLHKSHSQSASTSTLLPTKEEQQEVKSFHTEEEEEEAFENLLKDADEWNTETEAMEDVESIEDYSEGDVIMVAHEALYNTGEVEERQAKDEEDNPEVADQFDEQPQNDDDVNYRINPYFHRSRPTVKNVFTKQRFEKNQTIGIWSPKHQIGVTTLTANFAFYLAQNKIYTAVLEGLTTNYALKDWLKRYTPIPPGWNSFGSTLHTDKNNESVNVEWKYRNVLFLPLDTKDSQYEWNADSMATYMLSSNVIDVTLVDLPTGEMASYTRDSLHYLNELWIVVNDDHQDFVAWKSYIQKLQKEVGIPIHLIFNKAYSFSQQKRLAKELNLPLITSIPGMEEEVLRNHYENIPLFFKESVQERLLTPYYEMASHLFKGEFTPMISEDLLKDKTIGMKLLEPFSKFFKPLKQV